jgi:signal transduction histidine kinase
MSSRFAPKHIIALGTLLVVICVTASTLLAMDSRWLGIQLHPHAAGLQVAAVDPAGPAAGKLRVGDVITALGGAGRAPFNLRGSDLMEDPYDLQRYADYRDFFHRQSIIYSLLDTPATTFWLQDGRSVTVASQPHRELTALPALFWFQLLCGGVGMLIGVAVFAFRSDEIAPRCFALSGSGLLTFVSVAAVYSTRELALPGGLFYTLSLINQYGTVLFVGGGTPVLWYYPRRIAPLPMARMLLSLYAVFAVLHTLQVWDSLNVGIRFPIFFFVVLNILFGLAQWRLTRGRPASRAALKWLLYAWFTGILLFQGLRLIPVALGYGSLIPQAFAWLVLVFIYVGIALGITRYRLFELDRWVLKAWFWIFGGLAVIGLDLLLIYFLDLRSSLAVAVSLAVVGWVYFPLRQVLWSRLTPGLQRVDYQALLPDILETILSPHHAAQLDRPWQELLQRVYQPLEIKPLAETLPMAEIRHDGLRLRLPGLTGGTALELTGAARGGRLFNPNDIRFTQAVWGLFNRVQEFRLAFEQGANEERRRIARDLHDDVAARLLTLVHRAEDPGFEKLARQALSALRDTIYTLDTKAGKALEDALDDLRFEVQQRLDAIDITLDWRQEGEVTGRELSPRQHINLQRIVQELVSNAINHAQADRLRILILLCESEVVVKLCDNGLGGDPAQWVAGKGLHNVGNRARELQGQVAWADNPGDGRGCCVRLSFPLN